MIFWTVSFPLLSRLSLYTWPFRPGSRTAPDRAANSSEHLLQPLAPDPPGPDPPLHLFLLFRALAVDSWLHTCWGLRPLRFLRGFSCRSFGSLCPPCPVAWASPEVSRAGLGRGKTTLWAGRCLLFSGRQVKVRMW